MALAPQRGRIRTPPLPPLPAERWRRRPQGGQRGFAPFPCQGSAKHQQTPPVPTSSDPSCQNGFLKGGCRAEGVIPPPQSPSWLCPIQCGVLGTGGQRDVRNDRGDLGSCLEGTRGTLGIGAKGTGCKAEATPLLDTVRPKWSRICSSGRAALGQRHRTPKGTAGSSQVSTQGKLRDPVGHRAEHRGHWLCHQSPNAPSLPLCPRRAHDAER